MKLHVAVFLAACAFALGAGTARGDEVPVCYNYGCKSLVMVRLEPAELKRVGALFAGADSPAGERTAMAQAVAWLYSLAGRQTPILRDRGGNIDDEGVDGSMDCIDHSTNTTTWLALAERQGWFKFHTTLGPIRRGTILDVHWSARVIERATGDEWVVDTWFFDPGRPAALYPVQVWLDGARPPGTENFRFQ